MNQDEVLILAQEGALADGYAWHDLSDHDREVYLDFAGRVYSLRNNYNMISSLRFVYVNLRDAADKLRNYDTEFALGRASGIDDAADLIQVILEEFGE